MKVTTHLIIEPRPDHWGRGIGRLLIVGMRKNKPDLGPGQAAVKVTLDFPESVFEDRIPEATVVVPPDLVLTDHVTAEIQEPY